MSITKVAKLAGVSTCTVSRVINGVENVSAQTVNRVQRAMDKIGYTPLPPELRRGPSVAGRTKKAGMTQSKYIAVLILAKGTFYETGGFCRLMRGINNAAAKENLLTTFDYISNSEVPHHFSDKNNFRNLLGVITVWGEPSGALAKALQDIPVVNISSRESSTGDIAMVGSELIGRMAANYLFEKGCKHVAFLNPLYHHPGYRARCEGFNYFMFTNNIKTEQLNDESISPLKLYDLNINDVKAKTILLLEKLVSVKPLPQGLFLPNDRITSIAYSWFEQNDIKPNRDILIVSSDDEQNFHNYTNAPAVVSVKSEDVGQNAVEQLLIHSKTPDISSQIQVIMKPQMINPGAFK